MRTLNKIIASIVANLKQQIVLQWYFDCFRRRFSENREELLPLKAVATTGFWCRS